MFTIPVITNNTNVNASIIILILLLPFVDYVGHDKETRNYIDQQDERAQSETDLSLAQGKDRNVWFIFIRLSDSMIYCTRPN